MSAALDSLFSNFREQPPELHKPRSSSSSKRGGRNGGYTSMEKYSSSHAGTHELEAPQQQQRVPFAMRSSSSLRSCNSNAAESTTTSHKKRSSVKSNTTTSSSSSSGDENVVIEEKRPRARGGEGYTTHQYLRGKLLGKGGFAKVYLCTAMDTSKQYAVKIVPKTNLVKARARQKVCITKVFGRNLRSHLFHRIATDTFHHSCKPKSRFIEHSNIPMCANTSISSKIAPTATFF